MNLILQAENLLRDFESAHSEFQIDNFIIGSAGDPWAQYKQCLREIHARRESVINLQEQIELHEMNSVRVRWLFIRKKKAEIEKRQWRRKRKALVKRLSESKRELARFVDLALELKKSIGEIGPDEKRRLEEQSWLYKARRMAGIDVIVNGRIGKQTLEMILALPDAQRREILAELGGGQSNPYKLLGLDGG